MWLKRSTPQNIVIGGAAGAFPPMIGWAAATGGIGARADPAVPHHLLLDAAAFLGAVALRAEDYARAGVPMLPVVAGAAETRRQILVYSLVLAPLGASPWLLGFAGLAYGAIAIVGGGADARAVAGSFIAHAGAEREPRKQLFAFSILYLFVLFAALLVEQALGGRSACVGRVA